MLHGMIVVHEGRPAIVCRISGTSQAPGIPAGPSTYELAPEDTPQLRVYLTDPKAEDIPLLPACGRCNAPAGWSCRPGCQVTWAERAALLEGTHA